METIDLITTAIISTITSSSIIAGALAFIGYITKNIFENYLNHKVEIFKVELEKASTEHQIKFQSLHAKRAQVIQELYNLMNQILQDIDLAMYEYGWTPNIQKQKFQQAFDSGRELQNLFSKNRIYFDQDFCQREQEFLNNIHKLLRDFLQAINSSEDLSETNNEIMAQWSEAHKSLYSQISPLNRELEETFRKLIGVA